MDDLLLNSISEKLLAIDQKTTEIVKTTGETNRSIDQIRSRLAAIESKEKSAVHPREQFIPVPAKPLNHHVAWSQTSDRKVRVILTPILSALGGMVLLSFVLTASLRTSLLLPYLRRSSPTTLTSVSSTEPAKEALPRRQIKKGKQVKAEKFIR